MRVERVSSWQGLQSMVEALGYKWHELENLHGLQGSFTHSFRLTRHIARQIAWDDPHDPLLLQFIPSLAENTPSNYELQDPIGDHEHMAFPGGIHRYPDRLLLWPHLACGVHCRFCFRRNDLDKNSGINWPHVSEYLSTHPEVREVILSGGDPGMLTASALQRIVDRLIDSNVEKFRIHSRVLATDPEHITQSYLAEMAAFPQSRSDRSAIFVHHVNHVREHTPESAALSNQISAHGIHQKAQGVLLRGVNDTLEAQIQLWTGLAHQGINPYYLHHLDLAYGTDHFRVSIEDGLALHEEMRKNLPPNHLPKYILDLPGGYGKVEVTSLHRIGEGLYTAISPVTGKTVRYTDPAVHPAVLVR